MSAEGGLLARFPTALVLVLPRLLANNRGADHHPGASGALFANFPRTYAASEFINAIEQHGP
jgi:hypothetical protein